MSPSFWKKKTERFMLSNYRYKDKCNIYIYSFLIYRTLEIDFIFIKVFILSLIKRYLLFIKE